MSLDLNYYGQGLNSTKVVGWSSSFVVYNSAATKRCPDAPLKKKENIPRNSDYGREKSEIMQTADLCHDAFNVAFQLWDGLPAHTMGDMCVCMCLTSVLGRACDNSDHWDWRGDGQAQGFFLSEKIISRCTSQVSDQIHGFGVHR